MQNDGDLILADELSDQEESEHGSVLSEDAASDAGSWKLGGMETDEPTAQSTGEGMGIDDPMTDFEDDPTGVDELDESTDEDGLLGYVGEVDVGIGLANRDALESVICYAN
jgi:hypothetical protein